MEKDEPSGLSDMNTNFFNNEVSDTFQLTFYCIELVGFFLTYAGYKNPTISSKFYELIKLLHRETKSWVTFINSKNIHWMFKAPVIAGATIIIIYIFYTFAVEVLFGRKTLENDYLLVTFTLAIICWFFFGLLLLIYLFNKLLKLMMLFKDDFFLSKIGVSISAIGLVLGLYQVITIFVNWIE